VDDVGLDRDSVEISRFDNEKSPLFLIVEFVNGIDEGNGIVVDLDDGIFVVVVGGGAKPDVTEAVIDGVIEAVVVVVVFAVAEEGEFI